MCEDEEATQRIAETSTRQDTTNLAEELKSGAGRARGATGEPIAGGSGSGAVLTGVLPPPRRRSWETDATPSAPAGHKALQSSLGRRQESLLVVSSQVKLLMSNRHK